MAERSEPQGIGIQINVRIPPRDHARLIELCRQARTLPGPLMKQVALWLSAAGDRDEFILRVDELTRLVGLPPVTTRQAAEQAAARNIVVKKPAAPQDPRPAAGKKKQSHG